MAVSVLILNYNGRALLEECLPSIELAAAIAPFPVEIIVIDNESKDDSISFIKREWPSIKIVQARNEVCVSYNSAAKVCQYSQLLLLNNDIKLESDCIVRLKEGFTSPDVIAVSARIMTFDGASFQVGRFRATFNRGLFRPAIAKTQSSGVTAFCPSGACLVDRGAFLSLGGFDPVYLPGYWEDVDWSYRAWKAGFTCNYAASAVMYHKGSATLGNLYSRPEIAAISLRNSLLFVLQNIDDRRLLASFWGWQAARIAAQTLALDVSQLRRLAECRRRLRAQSGWTAGVLRSGSRSDRSILAELAAFD